ncbi:MAG: hypothetical protein WAT20_11625 [Ferruginibacter sp.]|nr:hypothetical protein [Chitinophagaceae bacterium]
MAKSKKRKHHHDFHPPTHAAKADKTKSAVLVAGIFFSLLGIGIAYFAAGTNVVWLIAGAVLGAVGGYFFGLQIDKSFSKK